jgi:hypothetical protein
MPRATDTPSTPASASADAALVRLSDELWTISNLLKAADANEIEIDDRGLAAAISRYWCIVSSITGRVASTDHGRIAKLRAALITLGTRRGDSSTIALAKSAIHDSVSAWDEARSRERMRP